jgi:hypothetical protein
MSETALVRTRQSLHAVAELILAGAQYAACERISLMATPGGFGTRFDPALRVQGADLVGDFGQVPLDGKTVRELCAAAAIELISLTDVYADGAAYGPDERLSVDAACAAVLADAWQVGHDALLELSPDSEPILWPEHFDVGITVDEINYGVSPGDSYLAVPYAYVGPWNPPAGDPFFNAPFGAARPLDELSDLPAFLDEGRRRSRSRNP